MTGSPAPLHDAPMRGPAAGSQTGPTAGSRNADLLQSDPSLLRGDSSNLGSMRDAPSLLRGDSSNCRPSHDDPASLNANPSPSGTPRANALDADAAPGRVSPDDIVLDDEALRDDGLAAVGAGRVLVIGCGALAKEILALKAANHWDHLDLTCLPAILHNYPQKITRLVEEQIEKHRADYARIFVAYADCGTGGGLRAMCERQGVDMIAGPHCYAFYDGLKVFETRDEVTTYYLTDFLARQFDAFVWKPLGLDRHPELLEIYFGNYEKLVYLAQTENPALDAKAAECAARLGLAYERRFTGMGDLRAALSRA